MSFFDHESHAKSLEKIKYVRWGLSVVYGLPVSTDIERILINIQQTVEEELPRLYSWYKSTQFHATLIRGKSSDAPLPRVNRVLLQSVIQKIAGSPETIVQILNPQLCPDGYIRVPFISGRLFPSLVDEDITEMERTIGLSWRRVYKTWITVGFMQETSINQYDATKLWLLTDQAFKKLKPYWPFILNLQLVKLIHFSNVVFWPIEEQKWIEIPLGLRTTFDINTDKLGLVYL